MQLALFDLDGTLLDGDTDVLWGEALARHGVFDPETTAEFQRRYAAGDFDANDFVARFLAPIQTHGHAACSTWLGELLQEHLYPALSPRLLDTLADHRAKGHELILATATNEFLTRPIAQHLGIPHLLASPAEHTDGIYTGQTSGPACFGPEKLARATAWLRARDAAWESIESWFYTDSIHDLPLLKAVTHPVAVDPDAKLLEHASKAGWPIVRR